MHEVPDGSSVGDSTPRKKELDMTKVCYACGESIATPGILCLHLNHTIYRRWYHEGNFCDDCPHTAKLEMPQYTLAQLPAQLREPKVKAEWPLSKWTYQSLRIFDQLEFLAITSEMWTISFKGSYGPCSKSYRIH